MHMADALVAPAVAATMYVCSGGAAGFSVKKVRLESDPKRIPVMGVIHKEKPGTRMAHAVIW